MTEEFDFFKKEPEFEEPKEQSIVKPQVKPKKLSEKPRKEPEPEESIEGESRYLSSNMIRYFGEQVGVKSKILRESSVKTRDAIVKILQKARFTK